MSCIEVPRPAYGAAPPRWHTTWPVLTCRQATRTSQSEVIGISRHYCPEFSERTYPNRLIHSGFSVILGGVGLKLMAVCPTLFEGGLAHEHRKDTILAADGLPTLEHIHADRRAVSWRPLGANVPLHRAISGHGVRAADLPRKLARYRGMPVGSTGEAFAHGLSRSGPAIDAGRCK